MKELIDNYNNIFENIKHIDEYGNEYWEARELQKALEYNKWGNFDKVINKAKEACRNSNIDTSLHFADTGKMSTLSNGGIRKIDDYKLSRYACYLIAQNGDSRKEVIALAQTYFAIQTRCQELIEQDYSDLPEDKRRIYRRKQIRTGNYDLNKTAVKSGVKDLARFHNAGYK